MDSLKVGLPAIQTEKIDCAANIFTFFHKALLLRLNEQTECRLTQIKNFKLINEYEDEHAVDWLRAWIGIDSIDEEKGSNVGGVYRDVRCDGR